MDKFVLVPDSFKGSMTSAEVCEVMAAAIKRHYPNAAVAAVPVADGGEGSTDSFLAAVGGEKRFETVQGPFGEPVQGYYGLLPGGQAVVEMACCAGLPLAGEKKDPGRTTTYGVGQLMLAAAAHGAHQLIVGLGGSATNDGGCGAAAAAGVRFYNAQGQTFVPVGGTLREIVHIDAAGLDEKLKKLPIIAMCDIDNPMTGPTGAAHVFGPQKGADAPMVEALDQGLVHLAGLIKRDIGTEVEAVPGAGAAGAMGAGMLAFFGASLQMGIETVLDTVQFDQLLKDADLVFTGEGKLDGQSLRGKVVVGVARRCKAAGVPVFAVVGDIGDDAADVYDTGVSAVFSINTLAIPFAEAKKRSRQDLATTMDNLLRAMRVAGE